MTGTTWVEESGFLEGPVMITNTHSVGVVRDAVVQWRVAHGHPDPHGYWWSLPIVAETWDGWLNDINGFHVKPDDAFHAIDSAQSGPVPEGNVGGGNRNDLQRIQGWHRHFFSQARSESRRLHRWRARAVQLRLAPQSAHSWRPRRQGNSRGSRLRFGLLRRTRSRLHHCHRRHGRSPRRPSTQASRPPRLPWARPQRQHLRQRL